MFNGFEPDFGSRGGIHAILKVTENRNAKALGLFHRGDEDGGTDETHFDEIGAFLLLQSDFSGHRIGRAGVERCQDSSRHLEHRGRVFAQR